MIAAAMNTWVLSQPSYIWLNDGDPPSDATASVLALVTKAKQKVLFDLDGGSITIEDDNGNSIVLDSSGVTLKAGGQSVALGTSSVSVNDGALEVT